MQIRSRWLLPIVIVLLAFGPAVWASEGAEHAAHVWAPTSFGWVHTVLLGILWLFVLAVLTGPVVLFFQPPPPPDADNHHDAHDAHDAHAAHDSHAPGADSGHH